MRKLPITFSMSEDEAQLILNALEIIEPDTDEACATRDELIEHFQQMVAQ